MIIEHKNRTIDSQLKLKPSKAKKKKKKKKKKKLTKDRSTLTIMDRKLLLQNGGEKSLEINI